MQDVPNLGGTPEPGECRDAVHVAVIAMMAGEELKPGERVTVSDGKAWNWHHFAVEADGVVDPFRKYKVEKGERFWLCLMPGTIRSLRHHWTHPKFSVIS